MGDPAAGQARGTTPRWPPSAACTRRTRQGPGRDLMVSSVHVACACRTGAHGGLPSRRGEEASRRQKKNSPPIRRRGGRPGHQPRHKPEGQSEAEEGRGRGCPCGQALIPLWVGGHGGPGHAVEADLPGVDAEPTAHPRPWVPWPLRRQRPWAGPRGGRHPHPGPQPSPHGRRGPARGWEPAGDPGHADPAHDAGEQPGPQGPQPQGQGRHPAGQAPHPGGPVPKPGERGGSPRAKAPSPKVGKGGPRAKGRSPKAKARGGGGPASGSRADGGQGVAGRSPRGAKGPLRKAPATRKSPAKKKKQAAWGLALVHAWSGATMFARASICCCGTPSILAVRPLTRRPGAMRRACRRSGPGARRQDCGSKPSSHDIRHLRSGCGCPTGSRQGRAVHGDCPALAGAGTNGARPRLRR